MEPITKFTGRVVSLPNENVDTDQIIPARFLKVIDKKDLAEGLFYDWRYDVGGRPRPEFVLNQAQHRGAAILLAGDNFGCGSSREHAPWALLGFGFRAIISSSFADIFRNNSLKNGLLPLVVPRETHLKLFQLAAGTSELQLTVDLISRTVELPDGTTVQFPIDNFSRKCLLNGVDELGYLLNQAAAIDAFENRVPPRVTPNTLPI